MNHQIYTLLTNIDSTHSIFCVYHHPLTAYLIDCKDTTLLHVWKSQPLMAYLHCRTWLQEPTRIQIPNSVALYRQCSHWEHSHSGSLIITVPIFGIDIRTRIREPSPCPAMQISHQGQGKVKVYHILHFHIFANQ